MILDEKPIEMADNKGNVTADVEALLQFLSKLENAPILATGHGSREEQDAVVRRGTELGVAILVNHPYYGFDVHIEDLVRWAGLGAYIELTAVSFVPGGGAPPDFCGDHAFLEKLFEKVPIEQFVLDSDMGQPMFVSPVEGVYQFIQLLMKDYGLTEKQINIISKETPAKLMHI
jgi:hypothetical protein